MELVQTDLTFNIMYLLSMFNAICFFEVSYFKKKIRENLNVEMILLSLLLIGSVQLLLCNLFVSLLTFYFVYNALKLNQLNLKKIFIKAKDNHELSIPLGNLILFTLFIILMYVMILKRFTLI